MFNKKSTALLLVIMIVVLVFTGCSQSTSGGSVKPAKDAPKYVFYLIGDGLGASQRQVSEYYLQHKTGDANAKLAMNEMPVAGINTTFSADTLVTDSAAAGTALACGVKTNNGVIAQLPDGTNTKTLVEAAQELGYATGVVTSTRLTHATPASFVAHNESRGNENEIAEDYLECNVDFIAGGGVRHFLPSSYEAGEADAMGKTMKSKREDDNDLVKGFADKGYNVFTGETGSNELNAYEPQAGDKVFAALTYSHMPYELDRANADTNLMSLSELTESAVSLLEQDKDGFFLMVEAGRIDHACHPNDIAAAVGDTLEFDEVLEVAMEFYNENPKDTLIVVVGDHETGGMGLGFATDYFLNLDQIDGITASFEDVFGWGYEAGADRDAYFDYLASIGIGDLTAEEKAHIEAGMDMVDAGTFAESNGYEYNEAGIAVNDIVSERVGVQWTTYAHTGTQIPFGVIGKGETSFGGFMDNTEIANTVAELLGVTIG